MYLTWEDFVMVAGRHIVLLPMVKLVLTACSAACKNVVCLLRQPCSTSVSKGTIGWLVLYVDSLSGSVDTACAKKAFEKGSAFVLFASCAMPRLE